jgi:hypothetical protein
MEASTLREDVRGIGEFDGEGKVSHDDSRHDDMQVVIDEKNRENRTPRAKQSSVARWTGVRRDRSCAPGKIQAVAWLVTFRKSLAVGTSK